jgi:hypothetical protein
MSIFLSLMLLQAAAAPATPSQPPAQQADNKKICRNISVTSSRLRVQRVCLSKEQWRRREQNQHATRYVDDRPSRQPDEQ